MTDPVQVTVSTLMLSSTTNESTQNITLTIPVQVMRLRSYRLEFTSAAAALAKQIVYLDIGGSYFDPNTMLDSNVGRIYFPLLVDFSAVTLETGADIPINLSRTLPEKFTMRILDSTFSPVADFVSFHAIFELSLGHSF